MSGATMRTDRWRRLVWGLVLILVASQAHAVAHALLHVTPALAGEHQALHDHAHSSSHAPHSHSHHGPGLSCELCAAGHVTLAGLPYGPTCTPPAAHWLTPATGQGHTSLPRRPLCRDPPRTL